MTEVKFGWFVSIAIIASILIFFGTGGVIPLEKSDMEVASESGQLILLILGVFLLGVLVVLLIRRHWKPSLTTPLLDVVQQSVAAQDFFTTVEKRPGTFKDLVKNASKVKILNITGVNVLSQHHNVFEGLIRRNCEVQLLFLDPNSDAAKIVYGGKYDRYKANIHSSQGCMKDLHEISGNTISFRTIEHAPTTSIVLVYKEHMSESFVQVQLYFLRSAIGADRPIFIVNHSDRWFKVFEKEFDELWTSGRVWEPKSEVV